MVRPASPRAWRRAAWLLGRTAKAFVADNISRLGAALAFYTTLAVAPLLVLAVAISGVVFDEAEAREKVIHEIRSLAGDEAAEAVQTIENPLESGPGTFATIIGGGALLVGAFGVFYNLQGALNSIWRVPRQKHGNWGSLLQARLFSLATVIMTGFLLLVSLVLSAVLSWLGTRSLVGFDLPLIVLQTGNQVFSLAIVTVLFALIFKILPDRHVAWRHVWLGAMVTALLFAVGKAGLGYYLGRARIISAYGAAGSLVALLLWCYYAGQIVFFGAEFTRIATVTEGGRDRDAVDEEEQPRGLQRP